jgi:uncharacterized protein (TIGR03435 family)
MMAEIALIAKATVILIGARGVTRVARAARASVRSLILASALALILVMPAVSLILPPREVAVPADYASAFLGDDITRLVSRPESAAATVPASRSWRRDVSLEAVARVAWIAGAMAAFTPLLTGLLRVRRLRRRASPWDEGTTLVAALCAPLGVRRRVEVILGDEVVAPMTCGWRRPAIAMPMDAPAWPSQDLRRVLLHEIEHVRRHDWPIHVLARVTCAVYWFHPGVWSAWRQLALESERACDDAVVARAESTAYAEQLVALARRFTRGQAPLLSMADRRTLATRVAAILDRHVPRGRAGALAIAAVLLSTAGLAAAIGPLQAGSSPSAGGPNVTLDPSLRFAVASVRPNEGSDRSRGFGFTLESGRLRLRNQTLRTMISVAYSQPFGLFFPDERISGGPDWMNSDRFTIEARADRAVSPHEMGSMLRGLLVDRFNLQVRIEARQASVYALVLAKPTGDLGPELRPSEAGCAGGRCGVGGGAGRLQLVAATMPLLGLSLSELTGRPVVDRTGLAGSFDGTLTWAPAPEEIGVFGEPAPAAPEFGASLFTALEEQFGLRLRSERGGVEYLIVTSAEQPTPNEAPERTPTVQDARPQ